MRRKEKLGGRGAHLLAVLDGGGSSVDLAGRRAALLLRTEEGGGLAGGFGGRIRARGPAGAPKNMEATEPGAWRGAEECTGSGPSSSRSGFDP